VHSIFRTTQFLNLAPVQYSGHMLQLVALKQQREEAAEAHAAAQAEEAAW
jgi:hypothetical protein